MVLAWIRTARPEVSQALHDDPRPKPYTISPLFPAPKGSPFSCWFDVSVGPDWLGELLLEGASRADPLLTLGSDRYVVADLAPTRIPFRALLDGEPQERWKVEFTTPTGLREPDPPGLSVRRLLPLPMPDRCFGSWLDRWNRSTSGRWHSPESFHTDLAREAEGPLAIPEGLLAFVRDRAVVLQVQGGTSPRVWLEPGYWFAGFLGSATFGLAGSRSEDRATLARLTALARFAEFCGTGVETARGMGRTRWMGGWGDDGSGEHAGERRRFNRVQESEEGRRTKPEEPLGHRGLRAASPGGLRRPGRVC